MKYLSKSFSTPANSRAYVDGWERTFGEKQDEPTEPCATCGMLPDSGVHWLPTWGGGHNYVAPDE